jgi:tRNA dimethylallyltransferase
MQIGADKKKFFIVLFGPTGVGKTDLSLALATRLPTEILNMDVGQFYTPLSIGTAKPDWRMSPTPHHLFDILDTPCDYTVIEYRKHALALMKEIWHRNHIPLLVGGSGFYLSSLFFPPSTGGSAYAATEFLKNRRPVLTQDLWDHLNAIDPVRAAAIHPHDRYRITRALSIWHTTGKKPSAQECLYQPPASFILIFLTRDRQELYARIDTRVKSMLELGWEQEVKSLQETEWHAFLHTKKLIGYAELCSYLEGPQTADARHTTIQKIQQKTRAYAKRQETFWRMLEKKILAVQHQQEQCEKNKAVHAYLTTINLTQPTSDQYINELLNHVVPSFYGYANEAFRKK